MTKLAMIASGLLAFSLLAVPGPASAANAGGDVASCQLVFPEYPGIGGGGLTCGAGALPTEGRAVGAFLPGGPVCTPTCSFAAEIHAYGATCLPSTGSVSLPPLIGDASGTFVVANGFQTVNADFNWRFLGPVLVVTFSRGTLGAGLGVLLPNPIGHPTCIAPGPLVTHVAGLGLLAQ